MVSPLPPAFTRRGGAPAVADATLSDFSGGLKYSEEGASLPPKYSVVLDNIVVNHSDKTLSVRYGTKEFATLAADIIEMVFFANNLICFHVDGTVSAVDAEGVTTIIWNSTIAAALPGAPAGWSNNLDHIDFTEFRGNLIVVNGVDKPLLIEPSLNTTYLQDIATGSNLFTPVAKFITTSKNFVVMAGIAGSTELYISSSGTAGTWPGDDPPNNSTTYDVAAATGRGGGEIKAVVEFRSFLLVFMEGFLAVVELNKFDNDGNHIPELLDTFNDVSLLCHKSIVATDTDVFFATPNAILSAERNIFGGTIENDAVTDNISEIYTRIASRLPIDPKCVYAVRDRIENKIIWRFDDGADNVTMLVLNHDDKFNKNANRWSTFSSWRFGGGCNSLRNRLFLFEDNKIYLYGNSAFENEAFTGDKISDANPNGDAIPFTWEQPWVNVGNRSKSKVLRHLKIDTAGAAQFTVQVFVNRVYKNFDGELNPAAQLEFVAGSSNGFGVDVGPYGGGRRANDERFFGLPAKFKIMKLRVVGSSSRGLTITGVSMVYLQGTYRP